MEEATYYSKIEFRQCSRMGREEFRLILDLENRELSYQEFEYRRNMPAAVETVTEEFAGKVYEYRDDYPMKRMRNGKTGFEARMLKEHRWEQEVSYTYGRKLTDEEYSKILPLCDAKEFEKYRDCEMSMNDPGFIGYRDEVSLYFTGITNSSIPMLTISMRYYYDEKHSWPSEKLYRYIARTFFGGPEFRKCIIASYGGNSLFG